MIVIAMACEKGNMRAYHVVNDGVAIEWRVQCLLSSANRVLWRCSVRVSYYVLHVGVVVVECSWEIVRVCGGVNDNVSIE